jgi:SAM-dependent methyltransferase
MKEKFSIQSDNYLKYRPLYPIELGEYIHSLCSNNRIAWDCGTGNGQLAVTLSYFFEKVFATDISKKQIENSQSRPNIIYKVESSENTSFDNDYFDLITVAQAVHWFDFDKFYQEVYRTIKHCGIFIIVGYSLVKVVPEIDNIIRELFFNVLGKYWDPERSYVDNAYRTIPFPFEEIYLKKQFSIKSQWKLRDLEGYLNSWSAVQNFIESNNFNPIRDSMKKVKLLLKDNVVMNIEFPIFYRIGKVKK